MEPDHIGPERQADASMSRTPMAMWEMFLTGMCASLKKLRRSRCWGAGPGRTMAGVATGLPRRAAAGGDGRRLPGWQLIRCPTAAVPYHAPHA